MKRYIIKGYCRVIHSFASLIEVDKIPFKYMPSSKNTDSIFMCSILHINQLYHTTYASQVHLILRLSRLLCFIIISHHSFICSHVF